MGAQRLSHVLGLKRRDQLIKEGRDAVREFLFVHAGGRALRDLQSATPYEIGAICAEETM